MDLAPIVLFTYNRPNHTKQVLDALAANLEAKDSLLYIFCDGPKERSSGETIEQIESVRKIAQEEDRFGKVHVATQFQNLGLAESIIRGVSEVINQHGTAIIVEDDILASPGFLRYMNEALDLYSNEDKVGCLHAWNFPIDTSRCRDSTFFLKGADCWGWATWERSWRLFNPNGKDLLDQIRSLNLTYEFDRKGAYPFVKMLEDQTENKNDSWAIRWHASLFLQSKYCLYPVKPLVKNIGLDNSGVHSGSYHISQEPTDYIPVNKIIIQEAMWFFEAFLKYRKIGPSELCKTWSRSKKLLKGLFRL